jgi:hypothetical protein
MVDETATPDPADFLSTGLLEDAAADTRRQWSAGAWPRGGPEPTRSRLVQTREIWWPLLS